MAIWSTVLARINGRSELQRIVANTSWLFADRLVALVVALLVGAWIARYLGPAQYGHYNYALAFSGLFVPIAGLGLTDIATRKLVRAPKDKEIILGTALVLQFAASLITFCLIIVVTYLMYPDNALTRWLVVILSGAVALQAPGNTFEFYFKAQVQSKYVVWSRNIALLLTALIQVALIIAKAPLTAFAWAALAQIVFHTIGLIFFYHLSGQMMIAWRFAVLCAKQLLHDSWPLIFSGMAVVVYMKVDLLMLGHMAGEEALGVYSVAVRLSELWYFLPVAIATSVFPSIVRFREGHSEEVYRKRLQLFYDVSAMIAYIIAIPCAFLATPIVTLLFGSAYAEAGPILTIRIWTFIFVSLGVARNQWLFAENMTKFAMSATLLGGFINVGMNLALIPSYAGLGAAWATLISQAISAYFSSLLISSKIPIFKQQSLSLLVPFRLNSFWRRVREITCI